MPYYITDFSGEEINGIANLLEASRDTGAQYAVEEFVADLVAPLTQAEGTTRSEPEKADWEGRPC